jgi:hypothetical protein
MFSCPEQAEGFSPSEAKDEASTAEQIAKGRTARWLIRRAILGIRSLLTGWHGADQSGAKSGAR